LSFSATEEELTSLFSEVGPVVKARIGTDRETGRTRGFAFVEFASEDACAAAIQRLNGHEMGGRRLRVNDADDKPPPRAPGAPAPGGLRPNGFASRGGGDRFAPRSFAAEPPPQQFFEPRSDGGFDDGRRRPNPKGSRRGLRARKRSLWT
jgi:RNA recognition motif-containing protein